MKFKESEKRELKKSTSELKEALISIAAILNKHHKGEVYFGISNDGAIIGQTVTEKTVRDVSRTISEHIEPKIYPKVTKFRLDPVIVSRLNSAAARPRILPMDVLICVSATKTGN